MEKYPKPGEATIMCACLLAPEKPSHKTGRTRFCNAECPVTINRRDYGNCTEMEVWQEMIDLQGLGIPVGWLKNSLEESRSVFITELRGVDYIQY